MVRFALVLLTALLVGGAAAQTYVELILDASGSMWNRLDDGRYRIVAAQEALSDVIRALPTEGLAVGLRVYGSRVEALEPGACDDTALLVPLAGVDKAALQATVDGVVARGATPIVRSLRAAAEDFPADAERRVIVLVTDGEESCGGDLRAEAEALAAAGVEIELRIVGLDLSERAQEGFRGLGEFVNADSGEALAAALVGAVAEVAAPAPPPARAALTLEAPATVEAGTAFALGWRGARGADDAVAFVPAGTPDAAAGLRWRYLEGPEAEAGTVELVAPFEPGPYEARVASGGEIVARAAVEVVPSPVTLRVLDEAVFAGSSFRVAWTGPDGPSDYVTLVPPGAPDGAYEGYVYTRDGSPLTLTAPLEPGTWELRYGSDADPGAVAARLAVTVLPPKPITLEAPAEVGAGTSFEVLWTGPDGPSDYVTVAPAGAPDGTYLDYAYTRDGSPLTLTAPVEAGAFELRYSTDRGADRGRVFGRVPLTVTAAEVRLEPLGEIRAGSSFAVAWEGPDNPDDYLTIVPAGAPDGAYLDYAYTREGATVELQAPVEPGAYELRYATDAGGGTVYARLAVEVLPGVAVALDAPDEVAAGASFEVAWTGPDGSGDYVTVVPAGASDGSYGSYAYTAEGSPASLQAPAEPGDYELRYQSDRTALGVLARRPIRVR